MSDIDKTTSDDEARARVREQQRHVLRALLKEGKKPAEIKREYPTDWTLEEIEALFAALDDEASR